MVVLFFGREDFDVRNIFGNKKIYFRTENKIEKPIKCDLLVSYRYRHRIQKEQLDASKVAINVHTGFLPYCRGSDPHFWSVYDNVLGGISIHEIDENIDTGGILYRYGFDARNYLNLSLHDFWKILNDKAIHSTSWIVSDLLSHKEFNSFLQEKTFGTHHFLKDRELPHVKHFFERDPKDVSLSEIFIAGERRRQEFNRYGV